MIGIEQALALKLLASITSIMALRLPPAPTLRIVSPRNDSEVRFIHRFGLP